VIVAMLPVGMVQVAFHQIVRMVAMADGFMPAVGPMNVIGAMRPALVVRGTAILIRGAGSQCVFVDMIAMHVVKMTVVEIVDVALVANGRMAAVRTMGMRMSFLFHAGLSHCFFLSWPGRFPDMARKRSGGAKDPGPGDKPL
jgi:hypothetical protein